MKRFLSVMMLLFFCTGPSGLGEIIKLMTKPLLIAERGTITAWVAQTESNSFTFIPPMDWHLKCLALENSILLTSPDFSSRITLKLEQSPISFTNLNALRTHLLGRFNRAKIQNEFPCYSSGLEGFSFDLEEERQGRPPLSHRIALLPYRDATLELKLTTPGPLSNSLVAFDTLLASLQAEPSKPKP